MQKLKNFLPKIKGVKNMLTGKVKEKYETGKGFQGLIIDVDNPKFKFPLKAYDKTNELGVGDIQVGQSVEFDWEKTDFGNVISNITSSGDGPTPVAPPQDDTDFNYGANVKKETPTASGPEETMKMLQNIDTAFGLIDKFPNLKNLDQENKRAVAISCAITQSRADYFNSKNGQ